MRYPYQFNDKTDPEDYKWGMSAESMLQDFVFTNKNNYWNEGRGIEDRVKTLTEAVGGLADLLIMKGILSPQDFINAIGASSVYEVRESKSQ